MSTISDMGFPRLRRFYPDSCAGTNEGRTVGRNGLMLKRKWAH
jgi:hypothetical protein